MPVESSGWSCASEALADIRAYPGGLQTFVLGVFDQLDGLTDELLARELARQQVQRQAERDVLQGQIDRLASVAAELAEAVAEQKEMAGQKNRNGGEKG
jgi:hypothetical protein